MKRRTADLTAVLPVDRQADLAVGPASGSLAAGQSVTVTVTVLSATGLGFQTTLTVDPGGQSVVVEYPPAG